MNPNMIPRPASIDEAGLFYAQMPEQDTAFGCIGHVRMDFGPSDTRFWHTWQPCVKWKILDGKLHFTQK